MTRRWTTPEDIAAKVRRRWDDGTLLRAHATGTPFEPIELRIHGPKASEIGDDIGAVQDWLTRLDAGRHDDRRYALEWQNIGGRHIGRNRLPGRAVVSTLDQASALLGTRDTVQRFDEILAATATHPPVQAWVVAHPHRALELRHVMPQLVSAHSWLDTHRGSGRYLREIDAPGIDTKFAEQHRGVLAAMLGVPATPHGFLTGLGLRTKPEFVRFRPAANLGLPAPATEWSLRADELARLRIAPRTAIIVENEITYLSLEVPDDGIVIWGKGFEVDRVGRLPWLTDIDVTYWGDIDTHGFAILDRLRAWLPQTRSILMDRDTLVTHDDRWGEEARPTRARLTRLTADEHRLYEDLVSDSLGQRVRLEQERVDWAWASTRLGQ